MIIFQFNFFFLYFFRSVGWKLFMTWKGYKLAGGEWPIGKFIYVCGTIVSPFPLCNFFPHEKKNFPTIRRSLYWNVERLLMSISVWISISPQAECDTTKCFLLLIISTVVQPTPAMLCTFSSPSERIVLCSTYRTQAPCTNDDCSIHILKY